MSSKYAALPDLDQSQDIYETPDLASDVSTLPTTSAPDTNTDEDIDSTHLRRAEAARTFTDRISVKRHRYRAGDSEDEELSDEETPARRLARLKRELEELREDVAVHDSELGVGIDELAEAMETLGGGATRRLMKRIENSEAKSGKAETQPAGPRGDDGIDDYERTHALELVAAFDTRLAGLERAIGGTIEEESVPMLPLLDELARQMALLNSSTTFSLDAASRRVKQLVLDTEKLAEARKASPDPLEAEETVAKINALYGVLPTIERMRPTLPALLDRLRSLRTVHQDAARAAEVLKEVERKQEEMETEIKQWEEALTKVEEAMGESKGTIEKNVVKVEGWVREIERKVAEMP